MTAFQLFPRPRSGRMLDSNESVRVLGIIVSGWVDISTGPGASVQYVITDSTGRNPRVVFGDRVAVA